MTKQGAMQDSTCAVEHKELVETEHNTLGVGPIRPTSRRSLPLATANKVVSRYPPLRWLAAVMVSYVAD